MLTPFVLNPGVATCGFVVLNEYEPKPLINCILSSVMSPTGLVDWPVGAYTFSFSVFPILKVMSLFWHETDVVVAVVCILLLKSLSNWVFVMASCASVPFERFVILFVFMERFAVGAAMAFNLVVFK